MNPIFIQPQKGKQMKFLECSADIVIYGGQAGGGKTFGILLECARNVAIKGYGAVIFRRKLTEITREGALWDEAAEIYPQIGGRESTSKGYVYHWDEYGTKINFCHLTRDKDLKDWQGTQICVIAFDELTHFTKNMFFYMLSRNRSTCGVRPYVRATTNPDADSWVRKLLEWWIDADGYAIEERSGVIRWLINQNDELFWFSRKIDAVRKFPKMIPKSFTFIPSSVNDNKILMEKDPGYIANLDALPGVDRKRLKYGNWNARVSAGDYFRRENFEIVDALPLLKKQVRCWDLAATVPSEANEDPDWTVGMRAGICADGVIYIENMVRDRINPPAVKKLIKNTTTQDGKKVYITIPQDVGSAGKVVAYSYVKMLVGYRAKGKRVTGSKEVRATPASSQAGIGNIKLLRGPWNDAFLDELEGFPLAAHDDIVDTLSDCVEELADKTPVKVIRKPKLLR